MAGKVHDVISAVKKRLKQPLRVGLQNVLQA